MFTKPLNSTIFSVLKKEDADEIEDIWKEKFKVIYKQNIIKMSDHDTLSEESEISEFYRQTRRFN